MLKVQLESSADWTQRKETSHGRYSKKTVTSTGTEPIQIANYWPFKYYLNSCHYRRLDY